MEASVYYRSAGGKLREIEVSCFEPHELEEVRKMTADAIKADDSFAKAPFLALVKGGQR